MRARILPLDDLSEYGKTDRVAVLLTLSSVEAREIMGELTGTALVHSASPEELAHTARKLYELLQIIAEPDVYRRRMAQDIMNTEGRIHPPTQVVQVTEEDDYAIYAEDRLKPRRPY